MLPADETNNTGAAPETPSPARRRLLQGGLATGPVLMTIASRPVLGQTVCTASAMCSVIPVNSLNHAHAHVCEEAAGLSPERWKAMAPDWPSPYVAVVAPVVQDPASPTCVQTSAPAPTTTQATTAPSAYDTYRTRRTQMYASRGLTTMGGGTTTVTPTTTPTPTTSTTCTSPTVAPASTQTTTTTPSAYDAYRTQRAQLYANRGLTGLISNPPVAAPTTTTSTLSAPSAPTTQSTYTTTSAATTTQTTTSSYTYRPRGSRSPYIQGGTSGTSTTPTGSTSTPPVTSGPLVGPAGTNGTAFHCPTTGLNGQTFGSLTMLDVLGASGGAYDALGRYTVAALLNAKAGRVHVLPESTVRNMWNDCVTRGYYEPAAGVRWGAAEIVAYMQKTIA